MSLKWACTLQLLSTGGKKKFFKPSIPKHAQFSTRQLAFFQRRMTKNEDSLEAGRPARGYERT